MREERKTPEKKGGTPNPGDGEGIQLGRFVGRTDFGKKKSL